FPPPTPPPVPGHALPHEGLPPLNGPRNPGAVHLLPQQHPPMDWGMSVHEPPPPTGVPTPSIVHLPSGSCSSRMISSLQSNKKSPSIRAFENRDTGNENAGIPPRIPQRKPTLAGLRQQQTQQK